MIIKVGIYTPEPYDEAGNLKQNKHVECFLRIGVQPRNVILVKHSNHNILYSSSDVVLLHIFQIGRWPKKDKIVYAHHTSNIYKGITWPLEVKEGVPIIVPSKWFKKYVIALYDLKKYKDMMYVVGYPRADLVKEEEGNWKPKEDKITVLLVPSLGGPEGWKSMKAVLELQEKIEVIDWLHIDYQQEKKFSTKTIMNPRELIQKSNVVIGDVGSILNTAAYYGKPIIQLVGKGESKLDYPNGYAQVKNTDAIVPYSFGNEICIEDTVGIAKMVLNYESLDTSKNEMWVERLFGKDIGNISYNVLKLLRDEYPYHRK